MQIQEFKDGYCISHKGVDYKFYGKNERSLKLICEKVKCLLNKDIEELTKQVLIDNHLL